MSDGGAFVPEGPGPAPEHLSDPQVEHQPPPSPPPAETTAPHVPPGSARAGRGCVAVIAAAVLGGIVGAVAVVVAVLIWVAPRYSSTLGNGAKSPETIVRTVLSSSSTASVEAVAGSILPSVVNVAVVQRGYDAFGSEREVQGEGSGVIIRADGYILTNNHVIEGADRIVVRIGAEDLTATVVGTDPSSDLAVIRVGRTGLPAAPMGSSDDLKVGQTVVAFGSPFGLDKTVTSGIVSALHRSDLQESANTLTAYTNLIQTDAAINPGNSGGPLTDILGRVVGINTLIQTGGAQQSAGIGFAIPIDYAKNVADQLIRTGKVEHPFMGVSTSNVNGQTSPQGSAPVSEGALVEEVVDGSPADKAGIEAGDIIVRIGETDVAGFAEVFAAIRDHDVGETVEVEVVRDGERLKLQVTLGSDAQRR